MISGGLYFSPKHKNCKGKTCELDLTYSEPPRAGAGMVFGVGCRVDLPRALLKSHWRFGVQACTALAVDTHLLLAGIGTVKTSTVLSGLLAPR